MTALSVNARRKKEAKRKREARARTRSLAPKERGYDFGAWLRGRVNELPALKRTWSDALAEKMQKGAEYDSLLRRYAAGKAFPKTDTAYAIGEGIRKLRHPWACGIFAVHAAGELVDFYQFTGRLSFHPSTRRLAAILGLVVPLMSPRVDEADVLIPLIPSEILDVLVSSARRLCALWCAWRSPDPVRTLRPLPYLLRIVVEVAGIKALSVADREMIIARLLRAWAVQNGFSEIVAMYDEGEMHPPTASDLVDAASEKRITP
jgi:hypothetical protein